MRAASSSASCTADGLARAARPRGAAAPARRAAAPRAGTGRSSAMPRRPASPRARAPPREARRAAAAGPVRSCLAMRPGVVSAPLPVVRSESTLLRGLPPLDDEHVRGARPRARSRRTIGARIVGRRHLVEGAVDRAAGQRDPDDRRDRPPRRVRMRRESSRAPPRTSGGTRPAARTRRTSTPTRTARSSAAAPGARTGRPRIRSRAMKADLDDHQERDRARRCPVLRSRRPPAAPAAGGRAPSRRPRASTRHAAPT